MRMKPVRWAKSQPLAEHMVRDFTRVAGLYEYDPNDASVWQRRAGWLDQNPQTNGHRTALIKSLSAYNEKVDNVAPQVKDAIARLGRPETAVVVGGQQAGLFTGPLLVIYKAITIIQTAREAEASLGRPVVPVFWIAGEDHDFDEVNHTYVLSPQQGVEKLKIEHPTGVRTSISRLEIESWQEALAQLDDALMPTEFKPELMDRLQAIAKQSATLSDFFGRTMAWLFGEHGLVLLDSDDAELRRLEMPMFRQILDRRADLRSAYLRSKVELERRGYAAQADVADDGVNVFVFDDGGERVLLYEDEGRFTDRKRERFFAEAQLQEWFDNEPRRFSNNVMTRPLMQDYVLPVLAAVLGPGEIAYWALTGEAFSALGMQMPIIVPRSEYTLLEGTSQKHMDKYGLTPDDVMQRFDEKKDAWLKEQDTLALDEKFAEAKRRFREMYEPLIDTAALINPGLKKLGDTNLQKILEQIDYLESKASEANAARFDAALRQMERVRLSLAPLGKPQERVYNVLNYMNKFGDGWLRELLAAERPACGEHTIVYF